MHEQMQNAFLRCKQRWDAGQADAALDALREIVGGGESATFHVSSHFVQHYAPSWFEAVVTEILLGDRLLVPFALAFDRLWAVLPAQYLVRVLEMRGTDVPGPVLHTLSEAVAAGLISTDPNDYDVSGRVVVTEAGTPVLWTALGGPALMEATREAVAAGAWARFASDRPDLVAAMFLYAMFHPERPVNPEMVLIRLEKVAYAHPGFLDAATAALEQALRSPNDAREVVSVGMRIPAVDHSPECLRHFVNAAREREFEDFVTRCLGYKSQDHRPMRE